MTRIRIEVSGRTLTVPAHSSIAEIFGRVNVEEQQIIAAVLNNHVVSLDARINGDAAVRPVLPRDPQGQAVLRKSVCHMLHAAQKQHFPQLPLHVGQSLDWGYYYEVQHDGVVDLPQLADALTGHLAALAERELPFVHRIVSVEAADRLLEESGSNKTNLLRAWASPTVCLVQLADFVDIGHGPYAPHSGYARGARVVPYPPGLVLQFPDSPALPSPQAGRSLWNSYCEARDWNRRMGVATVGDLNGAILEDRVADVLRVSEALHEKKISNIAETIAARQDVRIVCVAGPSCAGKTTFVRRLSVQLKVSGIEPVCVSLDDYYKDRSDCPRDGDGEYDFEALEALKLDLIHQHTTELLAGKPVRIPRFEFSLGTTSPEGSWRSVQLRPNQVLLIEGIHGLNPQLTAHVSEPALFRIFVDGLTQLVIDEHNRLLTADCRLLRRLVRDRRYRGTNAAETISRWPSVQRGACRHIFPFQDNADAVFNSALAYESAVLKTFAWRYLLEVPRSHPARVEAYRLLKQLELFVPVFPDGVPANSVLREFIGGSGFSY